ncbi:alpha/beta fold hydrolase [Tumebacillus lipolyticus]|uniref:Alpha/beta fold hydrolase n=1 Tax=Tumebacillus lipolyticus TaxID=1280370 RepID=A0ABW4ZZM0_9BACL
MKRYSVEVDGREVMVYEQRGQGSRTALFLPGVGGSAKVWAYQLRGLSRWGRMISIEVPGLCGEGELPETVGDLHQLAPFACRVLDALGVADAIWIGNSLGGRIALEAALQTPERVCGLVLICTSGVQLSEVQLPAWPVLTDAEKDVRMFYQPGRFVGLRTDQARAADRTARRLYERLLAATEEQNLLFRLQEISVAALVVWGKHDGVIPREIGEAIAERIPQARLVVLERSAHVPQIEQPEQMLQALTDYFSERFGATDAVAKG